MTTQVLEVPKWLIIIRGIQVLLSVIVLALSAYGIYWVIFSQWGYSIFVSLMTILFVFYEVLTSRIPKWSVAYNYWAVLAIDIFGVIFWLANMGALAALRATFVVDVLVNGCGHTGSIGGGVCWKRGIQKRAVASHGYLNMISVSSGFSGINFILFIVCLVHTGKALHRARTEGSASTDTTPDDSKLESHGMEVVDPPPPASYGQPTQTQYQQLPPPANY